jgi:NAD(P)-dependent dehydrogenase (short-subunit alcohol dehydrogenase family)
VIEQITNNGGVDIIVHVAGGGLSAPSGGFAKLTPEQWHQTLELNLLGAVRLDRGLIPAMIDAGSGAIVHITSIQRKMPYTTQRFRRGRWCALDPFRGSGDHGRVAVRRRPENASLPATCGRR